jgi:sec-independent protein translocase protein TatA
MLLILNDVAGSEILLILVFVLIFFGAKSIPGLARTLGRTMRQVKDASADIQREIKKSGADMKKDLNLKGILEETAEDIRRPLDQHVQDLNDAVKYEPPRVQSHMKPEVIESTEEKKLEVEKPAKVEKVIKPEKKVVDTTKPEESQES